MCSAVRVTKYITHTQKCNKQFFFYSFVISLCSFSFSWSSTFYAIDKWSRWNKEAAVVVVVAAMQSVKAVLALNFLSLSLAAAIVSVCISVRSARVKTLWTRSAEAGRKRHQKAVTQWQVKGLRLLISKLFFFSFIIQESWSLEEKNRPAGKLCAVHTKTNGWNIHTEYINSKYNGGSNRNRSS